MLFYFASGLFQVMAQEADRKEIGERNIRDLFCADIDAGSFFYKPQDSESFYGICRKFNMSPELLKKVNNITDEKSLPDKLKIVPGNFSIVIERGKNILTLYRENKFFKEYNVATGYNLSTPLGEYYIITKLIKPPWIDGDKIVPPEDPAYPLGTRWMGLSGTRLGIHGTKDPQYIGEYVTSGCIRMKNNDIEELYMIVPFGTKVTIKE
jgi:hypothetical protein